MTTNLDRSEGMTAASPEVFIVPFFDEGALKKLTEDLESGSILEDGPPEVRLLLEQTVGQFDGLLVCVYSKEHPPPHFHVILGREQNSFRLSDGEPLYPDNGLRHYFKNIRKWHAENKGLLIESWNKNRPTNCPVGEYSEP